MSVDRELDHTIAEDTDPNTDVLATLDEQQQNLVQMQKLAEATVAPGVFRLPVGVISSAEGSNKWTIPLDHPTEGTINIHVDKPTTKGWVEDQQLVQLLRWYGIHDRDPYKLQTRFLYVAYKGDDADSVNGWELVQPPNYSEPEAPVGEQIAEWWDEHKDWRPPRNVTVAYSMLFVGALFGTAIATMAPFLTGVIGSVFISGVIFAGMTVSAALVTEP